MSLIIPNLDQLSDDYSIPDDATIFSAQSVYSCSCSSVGTGGTDGHQVDLTIDSNGDDGIWSAGALNNTQPLSFGVVSGSFITDSNVFLRFNSVAVPQGSIINKATLSFIAFGTDSDDDCNVIIRAHAHDNAPQPTLIQDVTDTTRTSSAVCWDMVEHWTDSGGYSSPNIACVIQELTNRGGWSSGSSLVIYIEENGSEPTEETGVYPHRIASDYDSAPANAVGLTIWYSALIIESPTGGVVCGGTSENTLAFHYVGSGGLLAGGSSTIQAEYSEIGSAGAEVNGTWVNPFHEIMDGGAVCGGAADNSLAYLVTPSGGVIVSGTQWLYRRTFKVAQHKVSADIGKFQLAISCNIQPGHISDETDLEFTDLDGVPLAFEVRSINGTRLTAYVKTPLSYAEDTYVVLWYGGNN